MPLILWSLQVYYYTTSRGKVEKTYYRNDVNEQAPEVGTRITVHGKTVGILPIVVEVSPDPSGQMIDVRLKMIRPLEAQEIGVPEEAGWSPAPPPHDLPAKRRLDEKQIHDLAESSALAEMSCTVALNRAAVIAMTRTDVTEEVFVNLARDTFKAVKGSWDAVVARNVAMLNVRQGSEEKRG